MKIERVVQSLARGTARTSYVAVGGRAKSIDAYVWEERARELLLLLLLFLLLLLLLWFILIRARSAEIEGLSAGVVDWSSDSGKVGSGGIYNGLFSDIMTRGKKDKGNGWKITWSRKKERGDSNCCFSVSLFEHPRFRGPAEEGRGGARSGTVEFWATRNDISGWGD